MRFSIFLGLFLALALPAAARAYDDPKELVRAVYAPYLSGQKHADLAQFYSTRLQQLFADHAVQVAADLVASGEAVGEPSPDFNPFIDADNALILDVTIGEPVIIGSQALITVSFHNFDHPSLLALGLVREEDGWKVDDISSMGAGENWMLSWVLLYDPWDVK
ncbi:MAG: hypothetical protein Q8L54_14030 [Devosia sp.]|nr:hypothetical protein [Devosia sp.]